MNPHFSRRSPLAPSRSRSIALPRPLPLSGRNLLCMAVAALAVELFGLLVLFSGERLLLPH